MVFLFYQKSFFNTWTAAKLYPKGSAIDLDCNVQTNHKGDTVARGKTLA